MNSDYRSINDECVLLVKGIVLETCEPLEMYQISEMTKLDDVMPVINHNGEFVKLKDPSMCPVIKIYNPMTEKHMYLSWTPEIESTLGIPLVRIQELESDVVEKDNRISELQKSLTELNDELECKITDMSLMVDVFENKPLWKIAISRFIRKISSFGV